MDKSQLTKPLKTRYTYKIEFIRFHCSDFVTCPNNAIKNNVVGLSDYCTSMAGDELNHCTFNWRIYIRPNMSMQFSLNE